MKKNKLFFLLVACTLSLGSLTACNLGGDVPSVSPSTANTSAGGESSALPGDSSQGPSNPSSNITPQPSSVSPSQPGSSNVAPSSTPVPVNFAISLDLSLESCDIVYFFLSLNKYLFNKEIKNLIKKWKNITDNN